MVGKWQKNYQPKADPPWAEKSKIIISKFAMSNEWPKKENNNEISEKENIKQALEKIKKARIFSDEYLKNISLVVFSMDGEPKELFENGRTKFVDSTDYNNEDFMQGKRVDFVVTHSRKDFDELDSKSLDDKQILPFLFFEGRISYEEFLAHEMAHNLFDREYIQRYGEFMDDNGKTNVSQEYLSFILDRIKELVAKHYPNLDINKFNLQRQKIAEIFAMTYEREFCKINKNNINSHAGVRKKIEEFLSNSEETLMKFNKKYNKNCRVEDFFEENHILSLIVAPLLEEEYPDFEDRKNLFW